MTRFSRALVSAIAACLLLAVGTPAALAAPAWRTIPEAPFGDPFAATWTGNSVVVAYDGGWLPHSVKLAAFDPGANAWRKLAPPPVRLQAPYSQSPTFAWTGRDLFVVGWAQRRAHGSSFAGHMRVLVYSPSTNSWRVLRDPPIRGLVQTTPVWTGHQLLIWGGNLEGHAVPAQGAAYDDATHTWQRLPVAPLHQRLNASVVWTGTEMLVWGGERDQHLEDPEGAAYDPRSRHWRPLPASPLQSRAGAATAWTGHELLVWSGYGSSARADGAAYDPAADAWRTLPTAPIPPRQQMTTAWTGRELFVWGGIRFDGGRATVADGALYDPATDAWRGVEPSPLVARWGAVAAWTGDDIVVVGGFGPSAPGVPDEPPRSDGARFTP
jgi:hypothetical protein